jgi:hypothetical protein
VTEDFASESPTIDGLFDDAALLSYEHQEYFREVVGMPSWHVSYDPPRFEFSGDRELVCTRFHVLGTAAPGPRSWLWSWANPGWYPDEVTELARSVRDFGLRHGISQLTEAEVAFDEFPGSPDDPSRITFIVGELAKAISGCWTWYNAPMGGGTRLAVLLEHRDLVLPTPTPERISHVLNGIFELRLPDHRRAMHSYAVRRGLNARLSDDDSKLFIDGPGLEVAAEFTDAGLVSTMSIGGKRPPEATDLGSLNLRVRIYPEEQLGAMREKLMTRPLTPGLLEAVVIDHPDSMEVLNRGRVHARDEDVFGAALTQSISKEAHYIDTKELRYATVTFIGGQHRYMGAHIHVLARHFDPTTLPYGALVSFPLPEYVLVYPLGKGHPIESLVDIQNSTEKLYADGENPISSQVFWWRPGGYEQLSEPDALRSGQTPDLRQVGIEIDNEDHRITLKTSETSDLITLWENDNR